MTRLTYLKAPAWILAGAAGLWLIFGAGFANYDTLYSLVWGNELAHGIKPQFDLPLAPTPHPLANSVGFLLAPLGDQAETAVVVLAFVALAALGYLTYRLASDAFGVLAGLVAAAIILTREPVLSFGVRAYIDIPYVVLLLCAVVLESRRKRAGWPVLALISLAGLLRPEAWLFAIAYWLYLYPSRARKDFVWLGVLAISAPAIWVLTDWLIASSPSFSFSQTRESADTLGRVKGIENVPITLPRRIGEILREPVLIGAVGGGIFALLWLRERARLMAVAGVTAVIAFCLLAATGLPIITRYVLLPATMLAIFCGAGVFGWKKLPNEERRHKQLWSGFGAVVVVLLVAFAPGQVHRLERLKNSIVLQQAIRDDLHRMVDQNHLSGTRCLVAVPNHRAVPLLALWLGLKPSAIVDAQNAQIKTGYLLMPANKRVEKNFILDRRYLRQTDIAVPPSFKLASANRSWKLYANCER